VRDFENRLLSRPVKLHWAGWTADTYSLQQAGWQLSAHQDIAMQSMQLALRHERYGSGVSNHLAWHYMEDIYNHAYVLPELAMHVFGRPVNIADYRTDWSAFQPIDAKPQMMTHRTGSLEDLVHFAPSLARTREIIVPEQNVDKLLERILELQAPAREARIRKEIMRRPEGYQLEGIPQQKFHAQILSLAT
jgi:hypothetical protein